MTRKEILDAIEPLNEAQRLKWLITLGWEMTISARAGYPNVQLVEDRISHLVAFNEIQHQIYNFIRHSPLEGDWKFDEFLEGLCHKAVASRVEGYFGAAVKSSLRSIVR